MHTVIPIYTLTWPCSKISSNSGFRDTVIPYQTNPDSTVQPCQQPPNSESMCVCVNCDTFHVHLPLCSHALFSNPPKYRKLIDKLYVSHIRLYVPLIFKLASLISLIYLILLYTINHYIPMMVGVVSPFWTHPCDRTPVGSTTRERHRSNCQATTGSLGHRFVFSIVPWGIGELVMGLGFHWVPLSGNYW